VFSATWSVDWFFVQRPIFFWNDRKKLSEFSHNGWKYRLVASEYCYGELQYYYRTNDQNVSTKKHGAEIVKGQMIITMTSPITNMPVPKCANSILNTVALSCFLTICPNWPSYCTSGIQGQIGPLPSCSKNTKLMQISKRLLDRAHRNNQLLEDSALNVHTKYV